MKRLGVMSAGPCPTHTWSQNLSPAGGVVYCLRDAPAEILIKRVLG